MYNPVGCGTSAFEILSEAQSNRVVIQDYRPFAQSLEWELGLADYERGSTTFLGSSPIPNAINNDGNLSAQAAELFVEELLAADELGTLEPDIRVLELGPGLGLFARYFLDGVRRLCRERGLDYYERLTYVAGDRSERMLADLCRRGVFANHPGRYELRVIDALAPSDWLQHDSTIPESRPFRAVFLNYLLDSLPATVLKIDGDVVKQLYVKTCLARGVRLSDYTDLSAQDLADRAKSQEPRTKRELANLFDLFASEYAYECVNPDVVPYGRFAVDFARSKQIGCVLHNYGAIQSLERLLSLLHPQGFALINDYGSAEVKDFEKGFEHQRFGDSVAVGVGFPLIEEYFRLESHSQVIAPSEANGHIHSRLIGNQILPRLADRFQALFSKSHFELVREPSRRATTLVQNRRYETAAVAYRDAIQRQPSNWMLMSEAAKFLSFTLRDPRAGLEMIRVALGLNPMSAELWNTLGDTLFLLERYQAAGQAFRRAIILDPEEVRARYNLAFVLEQDKDYAAALKVIADALVLDKQGAYREGLLRKQGEILQQLAKRSHERGLRGVNRVTDVAGATDAPSPRQ